MASGSDGIMTVAELIDTAFGEPDVNIVHHKRLQAVLYLLARQLRILERHVAIQIKGVPATTSRTSSNLSVTEVKLRTQHTKEATKHGKPKKSLSVSDPKGRSVSKTDKTIPGIKRIKESKTISEEPYNDKNSPPLSDRTSTDKPIIDKGSLKRTSLDITSSEKNWTEKGSEESPLSDVSSIADTVAKSSRIIKGSAERPRDTFDKKSTVAGGRTSTTDIRTMGPQDYQTLLDEVEEMRERELRIIRQRADSREQREKSPTPIASMDSVEATYEKLLVVERVSPEEAEARAARERSSSRKSDPGLRISVVTQKEFEELAATVHELQEKFGPIATPAFPENAQLMHDLRKGASLTDAMAALQLSARLEATEKTLNNMISLVTELSKQTAASNAAEQSDDIKVLFGGTEEKKKLRVKKDRLASKQLKAVDLESSPAPMQQSALMMQPQSHIDTTLSGGATSLQDLNIVTYEEMKDALTELREDILKSVTGLTARSTVNAEKAFKIATKLEGKLDVALNLGNKMDNLENLIANYADQINVLDTGLTSQMTEYQEELTQMQLDLESGLETMAEVLANTGGDASAVAELNAHFSDLQTEIESTLAKQKELKAVQCNLSVDLDALRRQIEILKETKADREEVVDALRDKAGLGALNGLVSHQQFDAVRGDLEKRIRSAYDKFNNQEVVWQKAIDDLLREIQEKADIVQVVGLRDQINNYLEDFRNKLKFIMDIVGDPPTATLTRRICRDGACLSCATPAHMKIEEETIPKLPALRPAAIGAEGPKPKEDGDHGVCVPGFPIPLSTTRAHLCKRWCGGSHTLMTGPITRAPAGMNIRPLQRNVTQEQGSDGKVYVVDEIINPKPCAQCNVQNNAQSIYPVLLQHQRLSSPISHGEDTVQSPWDMVPFDYRPISAGTDVTPPPIFDEAD